MTKRNVNVDIANTVACAVF